MGSGRAATVLGRLACLCRRRRLENGGAVLRLRESPWAGRCFWRGAWSACWALLFAGVATAVNAQYAIRWQPDPAAPAVEVEGITRDALQALEKLDASYPWMQILAVYAEQAIEPGAPMQGMPPIAGVWKVQRGKLRFEPKFPFARGVAYRADFWPSRLPSPLGGAAQLLESFGKSGPQQGPVISFFELPKDKAAPSTSVLQIYPSGDVLPENQLKFYVAFSGPMSRGSIYEHIELRDAAGKAIELPFLELDEELWDPTMTRVTLLIDPGRIKRGVKPLEDIGPVFEEGKMYTLTIKPTWKDAAGQPLKVGFAKTYRVGPADRTPPDPKRWRISYVPPAGAQGPFILDFDEPMDRALALRLIEVRRKQAGREVVIDGDVSVDQQERRWMLMPVGPWREGQYRLVVATTIEDLAGNNIGKTFDVELSSGGPRQLAAQSVSVEFEVK